MTASSGRSSDALGSGSPSSLPAGSALAMIMLKTRADFLRVSGGRKAAMPGLVLQMYPSPAKALAPELAAHSLRVGYTCSRKVGNAVRRNRAKRRLREAARAVLPRLGRAGHDYVLIGRGETVERPFTLLLGDLETALGRVHGRAKAKGGPA